MSQAADQRFAATSDSMEIVEDDVHLGKPLWEPDTSDAPSASDARQPSKSRRRRRRR